MKESMEADLVTLSRGWPTMVVFAFAQLVVAASHWGPAEDGGGAEAEGGAGCVAA
jgi:hypothetical protein